MSETADDNALYDERKFDLEVEAASSSDRILSVHHNTSYTGDEVDVLHNEDDVCGYSEDSFTMDVGSTREKAGCCCRWSRDFFAAPPIKRNMHIITTAIGLAVAGICMFIAGCLLEILNNSKPTWALLIAGPVLLLPGIYVFIIGCCATQGKRGYRFSMIPNFRR